MTESADAVCLVANLLSVLACLCMLRILWHGRRDFTQQRVFRRLLVSLALSDLCMHSGLAVYFLVASFARVVADGDVVFCSVIMGWNHSFRFVSALQEMHMACHFLLQAYRWRPSLLASVRRITVAWVLGTLLSSIDIYADTWSYNAKSGWCLSEGKDYISICVHLACFVASCLSYCGVTVRSCQRAPGSVMRRALRRAAVYPLNFVASYAGLVLLYVFPDLWDNDNLTAVAVTLLSCNGLMNALTYMCQIRYAAKSPIHDDGKAQSHDTERLSFVVEIGDAEVIEYEYEIQRERLGITE